MADEKREMGERREERRERKKSMPIHNLDSVEAFRPLQLQHLHHCASTK